MDMTTKFEEWIGEMTPASPPLCMNCSPGSSNPTHGADPEEIVRETAASATRSGNSGDGMAGPGQPDEKKTGDPCPACHGLDFWLSVHDRRICRVCHPPACKAAVRVERVS